MRWLCAAAIVAATALLHGCAGAPAPGNAQAVKDYSIDTTGIPHDTVDATAPGIALVNGLYMAGSNRYSGIIRERYAGGGIRSYRSVLQGMMHGTYTTYYQDGTHWEVRHYRNNLATGRHCGYWPGSGRLRFEYTYYEERKEGMQRLWYQSGKPFIFSHYVADREDGLQQAWRENGKLYINYVARDGHTYGLQQTALCYTLVNQEIKKAREQANEQP
jgi:antitoxin component YwqK of YwqJK toxin-antitoxin module